MITRIGLWFLALAEAPCSWGWRDGVSFTRPDDGRFLPPTDVTLRSAVQIGES
jgi:hypothetical protein